MTAPVKLTKEAKLRQTAAETPPHVINPEIQLQMQPLLRSGSQVFKIQVSGEGLTNPQTIGILRSLYQKFKMIRLKVPSTLVVSLKLKTYLKLPNIGCS